MYESIWTSNMSLKMAKFPNGNRIDEPEIKEMVRIDCEISDNKTVIGVCGERLRINNRLMSQYSTANMVASSVLAGDEWTNRLQTRR